MLPTSLNDLIDFTSSNREREEYTIGNINERFPPRLLDAYFRGDSATSKSLAQLSYVSPSSSCSRDYSKPSAFEGNIALLALSLNLVSLLPPLLTQDVASSIAPSYLSQLLRKTEESNPMQIKEGAGLALKKLASAGGWSGIKNMVQALAPRLLGELVVELQVATQSNQSRLSSSALFQSARAILDIVLQNLNEDKPSSRVIADGVLMDRPYLVVLVEVIGAMCAWFDKCFEKKFKDKAEDISVPMGLMKSFDVSVKYIITSFNHTTGSNIKNSSENKNDSEEDEPWLNELKQFEIVLPCDESDDSIQCKIQLEKEGISNFQVKDFQVNDFQVKEDVEATTSQLKSNIAVLYDNSLLKKLVKCSQRILFLACFFLPSFNLQLKQASCDTICQCLRLLALLENYVKVIQ